MLKDGTGAQAFSDQQTVQASSETRSVCLFVYIAVIASLTPDLQQLLERRQFVDFGSSDSFGYWYLRYDYFVGFHFPFRGSCCAEVSVRF